MSSSGYGLARPALVPRSERWRIEWAANPSPLCGSNGAAFGPDGRLYVAQFVAGRISAVDLASGDLEVVLDPRRTLRWTL